MRSFTTVLALPLLWLLPAMMAAPGARAADTPSTMLLIDGSGSMWGRIDPDKRAKIDIVRELLKPKIDAPGPNKIGLTSFGHRRKGDCSDVEVIAVPSASHDLAAAALEKLSPKGKGPLAAGLREAAASLGQSRPASIIVVGDGADNCQQDACAAADEIAKSSPGLTVHVISFAVDPLEVPRLACIAKATGGNYYDVKDAPGMVTAIDAATRLALLAPNAAVPIRPAAEAAMPVGASLRAAAVLAQGGEVLTIPLKWQIFAAGAATPLLETEEPDVTAKLDPGRYDIVANLDRLSVRQAVTIESGKAQSLVLPLKAARLKMRVTATKTGEPLPAATVTITPAEHDGTVAPAIISQMGLADEILPPGTYTVAAFDGDARQTKSVTLTEGADTALDVVLDTGRLEVSAKLREDGGAIDDVTFTVAEDDPDSPDGRRDVARSKSAVADFSLAAGTYYVTARAGQAEVRQRIAVSAGETVKRVLVLPLAPLKLSTLIAGQTAPIGEGIVYRVTALDGDHHDVARSIVAEPELMLAPGRYHITAQLIAHRISAAQDVTLEAGKRTDVVLKIDAAEIALKPPAAQAATADVFWEIVDAKGQPVWRTTVVEPKTLLSPGRYTVRFEARDKHTEAAFEVRSGDHRQIDVGGP